MGVGIGKKLLEQLKRMRTPRAWVLEERNPVEGQVLAYQHEMTESMRSEAVSPWVTRFGPSTLEECRRKRDEFLDKSQLRIRNLETDEVDSSPATFPSSPG